jgi:apolipoprotein D and lipocalin family protein
VYRLIFAALLLASCAQTPTVTVGRYRSEATPIYSSAVLDASRLTGRWQQVAAFGPETGCKAGAVQIDRTNGGLQANYRLCLSGTETKGASVMQPDGPGRFAVKGQPGPWWVLWADADYRTLVIGTPSGRLGFILNRDGVLPPDRLKAAREILDWNGYDLSRLQVWR